MARKNVTAAAREALGSKAFKVFLIEKKEVRETGLLTSWMYQ
jgi:hypothetical protein